jgi:nitrogen fixation NifU-like protein
MRERGCVEEELMSVEERLGLAGTEDQPRYGEKLLHYGNSAESMGVMDDPDAYGRVDGFCGDSTEMFLTIRDGVIAEARFRTTGCFFSRAACHAAVALAKGKSVAEALKIDENAILAELEGMPEDHEHCAYLAALTLRWALERRREDGGAENPADGDGISG